MQTGNRNPFDLLLFPNTSVDITQERWPPTLDLSIGLPDAPNEDETALHASTVTSVLFYTTPFLSEVADSMKDWVVTGICICHVAWTFIGRSGWCFRVALPPHM